jgi:hypothetical protein
LLSNSLTTSAASPTAAASMPDSRSSAVRRQRACATLDAAYGSRTTPDALTSLSVYLLALTRSPASVSPDPGAPPLPILTSPPRPSVEL